MQENFLDRPEEPRGPIAPLGAPRYALDASFGGGNLNELTVGISITVEVGVLGQVVGRLRGLRAHDRAGPTKHSTLKPTS